MRDVCATSAPETKEIRDLLPGNSFAKTVALMQKQMRIRHVVMGGWWALVLALICITPRADAAGIATKSDLDAQVNTFNGSMTESVDIDVPDFFDLTPELGLSYNSSSGASWVG